MHELPGLMYVILQQLSVHFKGLDLLNCVFSIGAFDDVTFVTGTSW